MSDEYYTEDFESSAAEEEAMGQGDGASSHTMTRTNDAVPRAEERPARTKAKSTSRLTPLQQQQRRKRATNPLMRQQTRRPGMVTGVNVDETELRNRLSEKEKLILDLSKEVCFGRGSPPSVDRTPT